jgi:hypothetical protein
VLTANLAAAGAAGTAGAVAGVVVVVEVVVVVAGGAACWHPIKIAREQIAMMTMEIFIYPPLGLRTINSIIVMLKFAQVNFQFYLIIDFLCQTVYIYIEELGRSLKNSTSLNDQQKIALQHNRNHH